MQKRLLMENSKKYPKNESQKCVTSRSDTEESLTALPAWVLELAKELGRYMARLDIRELAQQKSDVLSNETEETP